ncbi:MAG: hypothetical protein QOH42_2137 [Blastocatellia bacterium]|nr:hypothetical protein [Blastocatellia bacterium]
MAKAICRDADTLKKFYFPPATQIYSITTARVCLYLQIRCSILNLFPLRLVVSRMVIS